MVSSNEVISNGKEFASCKTFQGKWINIPDKNLGDITWTCILSWHIPTILSTFKVTENKENKCDIKQYIIYSHIYDSHCSPLSCNITPVDFYFHTMKAQNIT